MPETVTESWRAFHEIHSATRYDGAGYRQTYLSLAEALIPQMLKGEHSLARSLILHMDNGKKDEGREEAARLYQEIVEPRIKPMAYPGSREAFARDLFAAIIAAIQVRPRADAQGWVSDLLRRASSDEDAPAQTPAE